MNNQTQLHKITPTLPLSPLDGRYKQTILPLVDHLSEAALNRNRLLVEIEWFIHLNNHEALPKLKKLNQTTKNQLRQLAQQFNQNTINELSELEKETSHDVKAVEYFLKNQLPKLKLQHLNELVHFACTSEDINNLAYALGIKTATTQVWLPKAENLVNKISTIANNTKHIPMLAKTHGQPATPTTIGKELAVTAHRLNRQIERIKKTQYLGKINGATGTYAAHTIAAPETNWQNISKTFVEKLQLSWNPLTTQIESHDWQTELFADIARFNRILHNFCTDMWSYISVNYFTQKNPKNTVGSSTMPHKINPIRFENAEANLEISCSLLDTLANTLTTSRLQRDLSDSSTQRNIGVAFGHSLIAISNVTQAITEVQVNETKLSQELNNSWEILAEAIQTVMRAEKIAGMPDMENPYEKLKALTQGKQINAETLHQFLENINFSPAAAKRLQKLTPATYIGIAPQLVEHLKKTILETKC